ncbi:MAG: HPr family phosphocarrier protein [Selenomonadaceae bacterium]|nr:HPr family phosphocarrier protein [Selenomonadaceae bacterium]
MIERISESIRTDIQDLESILKLLDSPALKKILIDQNGDCESQIQIRTEIESLELALKLLDSPALKKIIIDQNGDCESQAQLFEQIGDESRAQAIREIGKRLDQFGNSDQNSSSKSFKKTVTIKDFSWASKQALFVSVISPAAMNFESKIEITVKGITADAKSANDIMLKFFPFNLFESFFSMNVDVTISAEGSDAEEAVKTLVNLIEDFH